LGRRDPRAIFASSTVPVRVGDAGCRSITMTAGANQLVVTLALATEAYEVRPGDKLHLNAVDVDGDPVLVIVELRVGDFRAS
jgi:hypothetical protein